MGLFQGSDTIPREVALDSNIRDFFKDYLPGWDKDGIYNFTPGAATNKVAAQLQIPLHYGSHPWINDSIKDLFRHPDWLGASPSERTRLLGVLVNFMEKAGNEDAIKSGGAKTGNYIAYTHRSDPHLLQKLGYEPTVEQMRAEASRHINWDFMKSSQAGQEILASNLRVVEVDRVAGTERASARPLPANDNNGRAWREATFNLEMVA